MKQQIGLPVILGAVLLVAAVGCALFYFVFAEHRPQAATQLPTPNGAQQMGKPGASMPGGTVPGATMPGAPGAPGMGMGAPGPSFQGAVPVK